MQRRSGPLSATFCRNVTTPGRYGDGRGSHGLYMRVHETASGRIGKPWGQRIRVNGRVTCLGLGSYPVVTLARARDKALANRRAVEEGRDPRRGGMATFRELAEKVIRLHAKSWKAGSKSPGQWRQTFRDYADPVIGDKPVSEITRSDVLAIVSPIWHDKPSAAGKVLRRVGIVLRYAVAQGLVEHNVADASAIKAALPKANGGGQRHFKALPHGEVAEALARVRASDSPDAARLALEFLVLTASRPGECREAEWAEIDLETATWTIPAERMKANREHRVPLSGRALEVLDQARELSDGSGLVFPSKRTGRPVSDWAFAALRRRADIDATLHGFRSSFRDWTAENGMDHAVAEAALAHVVSNATEAAYRRTDLFERRRELMEDWADYVNPRA